MDDPFLIFILIAIVWQLVGGLFGAGKRKAPGETKPTPRPVKRPRQTPAASRTDRTRIPEQPDRPRPTGRAQGEGPAWWDAQAEAASGQTEKPWRESEPSPTQSRPAGADADAGSGSSADAGADRPWWETKETSASEGRPGASAPDPWRDDPDRPSGPVVRTPEELWEILTGQRPPFPVPQAPRGPTPEPEARRREGIYRQRPEPAGDEDVVSLEGQSLEATEISSEARHEAFHRKIDRPAPQPRRTRALDRLGLVRRGDVRRAVVLAEVLGKPRSLAGPDW